MRERSLFGFSDLHKDAFEVLGNIKGIHDKIRATITDHLFFIIKLSKRIHFFHLHWQIIEKSVIKQNLDSLTALHLQILVRLLRAGKVNTIQEEDKGGGKMYWISTPSTPFTCASQEGSYICFYLKWMRINAMCILMIACSKWAILNSYVKVGNNIYICL